MATRLLSTTTLKDFIGPSGTSSIRADDLAFVELMLNGVVDSIEKYLNRKLEYTANDVEIIKPTGDILYVTRYPIESVASIIPVDSNGNFEVDNILETTDYKIFSEEGYIQSVTGWFGNYDYQVTYTGGYHEYLDNYATNDLPAGLALAIGLQFKWLYERRNMLGVTSQSTGDGNQAYYEKGGLLTSVIDMLSPYKRMWI